jgi:hypothetical protein
VQCPDCGFVEDSVTPADAAVALRSYPRRYRALLVRPDDEDGAEVIRRPGPDGWSALDHAAHVAMSLDDAAEGLRVVAVEDEPAVLLTPERPPHTEASVDVVLERLAAAADLAAAAVDRIKGKDWERVALVLPEGTPMAALDLARYAVHEGVHHLKAAEQAVSQQ